jgi:hypothetical protein
LPLYIGASSILGDASGVLAVQDGDLTDYRPSDIPGGSIIGLRFKLPHGTPYTAADKAAFCIA